MLVLTRRLGEKTVITVDGKQIVVTIVDIDRGKIRLGFEADKAILIDRQEVHIRRDDPAAA